MNTIILATMLVCGQAPIPSHLDKSTLYLRDMPVGASARVYKEALVVDSSGGCWLRGNYVVSNDIYSRFNRHKELEIIHNKLGWIVRIHPYWHDINTWKVQRYPQWTRGIDGRYYAGLHLPIKAINVVQPYRPRQSEFSRWDSEFRSLGGQSSYRRPTHVRIGVSGTFGY